MQQVLSQPLRPILHLGSDACQQQLGAVRVLADEILQDGERLADVVVCLPWQ
jgi:hypothetical protein